MLPVIKHAAHILGALSLAISLFGCSASTPKVAPSANAPSAPKPPPPPAAAKAPPAPNAPPNAQEAIQALKLKGTITHKLLRLNPQVELLLLERESEGMELAHDDEMSAELFTESWLVHKEGASFKVIKHANSKGCEDYELILVPVESLEALSWLRVGCANGADYWSSSEDVTLLYHGDDDRSPASIWEQTISHKNEMDQCSHETSLLINRDKDTIHIKTVPQASWSKTPEDPDISELTEASCKESVEPTKSYEVKLTPSAK